MANGYKNSDDNNTIIRIRTKTSTKLNILEYRKIHPGDLCSQVLWCHPKQVEHRGHVGILTPCRQASRLMAVDPGQRPAQGRKIYVDNGSDNHGKSNSNDNKKKQKTII